MYVRREARLCSSGNTLLAITSRLLANAPRVDEINILTLRSTNTLVVDLFDRQDRHCLIRRLALRDYVNGLWSRDQADRPALAIADRPGDDDTDRMAGRPRDPSRAHQCAGRSPSRQHTSALGRVLSRWRTGSSIRWEPSDGPNKELTIKTPARTGIPMVPLLPCCAGYD
jgi:hypothetical protein